MSNNIPTPLPIGKSFFDKIIESGCYYVDKTLLVKELLDRQAEVILCTRPRRFGKTINQTMLKCFFEDTADLGSKNTRILFSGLKIESAGDSYLDQQGKYPVIFLNFKDSKRNTFEDSYSQLKDEIISEFKRHNYVFLKISDINDKKLYEKLCSGDGSYIEYSNALKFLCRCLEEYHHKKVIILIDEYDVPLENSWVRNFYDDMINFMRPLLTSALKDNPYLQLSVMTGCLRIAKESIFTGLNNLDVISILSTHYEDFFGFTQYEVDMMMSHYGLECKTDIMKKWYDGYLFGETEVYNSWSIINYVRDCVYNIDSLPRPYWANTSSNDIIRNLINKADDETKAEIETLMADGTISKKIHEDISYDEAYRNYDSLWSFLFFTGYLKKTGEKLVGLEKIIDLSIPNLEIKYIYMNKIQEWFNDRMAERNHNIFFNAILNGDAEVFNRELSAILAESISYMDSAENFYHEFMVGILSGYKGYRVKSNRESGQGRSDLVMYAVNAMDGKAIIFEIKQAKNVNDLSIMCDEALKQIEENNYTAYWDGEGFTNILKYGISFYRKRCLVKLG